MFFERSPCHQLNGQLPSAASPVIQQLFLVVMFYGVFWFVFEPTTFDWHAIATLIVWTMTLFIQRADRRDTLAVHAKLDELLKATRDARTELASIDEREPEVIENNETVSGAKRKQNRQCSTAIDGCVVRCPCEGWRVFLSEN
jgi:low affinity Fe/Cu permease